MQINTKEKAITAFHKQIIDNEKWYQQALKNDEKFSVLKGFKNIIRNLKLKLEAK